jgi:hypothetical protein
MGASMVEVEAEEKMHALRWLKRKGLLYHNPSSSAIASSATEAGECHEIARFLDQSWLSICRISRE